MRVTIHKTFLILYIVETKSIGKEKEAKKQGLNDEKKLSHLELFNKLTSEPIKSLKHKKVK